MKKRVLAASIAGVLLSGCASNSLDREDILEREAAAAELQSEYEEDRIERVNEKLDDQLDAVPSWVFDPPANDAVGVYAVGSATSESPVLAFSQAKLKAEFQLSQAVRQEISGQERQLDRDFQSTGLRSDYELLVDRFVSAVPLKGHSIVESELYVQDGVTNAHVLYRISRNALSEVLAEQRESSNAASGAFEALESRIQGAGGDAAASVGVEDEDDGSSDVSENDA
jgi:hypothetical protein